MATIKIVLRTDKKPTSSGEYQLHLRLTHKREIKYISFPFTFKKEHWSKNTSRVRATHPSHAKYNQKLQEALIQAQETIDLMLMDNPNATSDQLRAALDRKGKETDYLEFSYELIEGLYSEDRVRYANRCTHTVNKLKEYTNGSLPFKEMDVSFLRRYKTYLKKERGNSQNTIYGDFKVLKTFYRQAILEGFASQADNPFFLFSVKQEAVHKDHLELKHIRAMSTLDLDGVQALTRDTFLFSFWCAGIRFSDTCKLKWSNIDGDILTYTMGKTKASAGSRKSIALSPPALAIIDKYSGKVKDINGYIFPWLDEKTDDAKRRVRMISSANASANKALKIIARKIKFNGSLSFHVSRHSFTSIADEVGDLSVKDLQALLGHSDSRTTEIYRNSLSNSKEREAMTKFYNAVKLSGE